MKDGKTVFQKRKKKCAYAKELKGKKLGKEERREEKRKVKNMCIYGRESRRKMKGLR